MEMAKITSKGQVTIPIEIRKKLNLNEGSKIFFFEKDGKYYIDNSDFFNAVTRMQDAFKGEAKSVGWKAEEDVMKYVKELRREKWEDRKKRESNA